MLRPTGRLLAQIVTTTLTFAMVTFTVVVVLLARGPLSLGFLSPYVATALNDDSSPLQISFSDTVLTWERKRRRLDIRIVDVIVTGADGERLAAVPQVGIKLRGSSLLKFEIEPERLVLIEPRVRIVRNEEGRLELGLGGEEEQEDLIETWFEGNWPRFTHALTQISIIDADLSFDDRVSGKLWRAPSSGLSLTRGDTGIVVELVAKMVIADRPAQIAVDALYRGRDAPVVVAVDFVNVEPAILALESGIEALSPLQALRMAVSGRLSMTLDLVRNLEEAHFNIHSGPGVLSLPDYYRTPLAITGARASGRVAGDIQTLQIEKLEIDLGDGVGATFAGVARMTEAGPDIRGEGGIVNLSTSALERFWPEGLRQRARRWVVGNISDGICDKAGLAVDVRAAELAAGTIRDDAVVFEFHCRDVTARYWKAMPALTHARGHGRINAKELLITVEEARMGDIALAEGTIKIDLRRPKAQFADITFLANGPTRSVLEILERKPLSLVQRLGLNAAGATGEASVRTRLRVPLKKGRKLSDIGYAVSASLSDFTMDEAFGTFRLDRGELQLTVAPDGVGAVGTVALNGVPASITWRHDFGAGPTHPSRYGMAAVLGDRERAALGLRFAPYVEGATKVELQLAKDRAGGFDVQGTADLAGARLSLAELGWEKPFGQQGAAEFAFRSRPGKAIEIDRFRVTAPEFEATGKASYGAAAQRIKFERVRFGGHDFGADVDLAADGATTIKVNGRVLDLRSIIDAQEGREAKAPRALRLTAALDNLIVSDSFWLKGAKATAVHGGGRWQEMVAVGGLNGGARVDIRMTPDGERYRKLVVSSADAGGTVAATGYLNGVRGGKLVLIARLPEDSESTEPVVGRLSAEDFMLVEAPRMTSVLKHRSIATNDDDAGDSVAFKRFEAPFVMRGEVIEVQRGRAAGLSVGLTIAGTIDRARESLDLSGNIVPAYAINSALGRIPLVGGLLVGRKGEGVFALGYRIQGALKDPKVTVNPLTALAPGVLRRLVEALGKPSADEPTGLDEDGPSTDSHTP